jgi:hypothetical protein
MGWTAGVRLPARARDLSLLHSVEIDSDVHRDSFSMGGLGSSFEDKHAGDDADHSYTAVVKIGGDIPQLPYTFSWRDD